MPGKPTSRLLLPPINETTGEPSFRWRRIAFFLIVGICFLTIPMLGLLPVIPDSVVNQKIVDGCFTLAGWAYLTYAGAATATDIAAIWQTRSGRPYADDPNSAAPAPPSTEIKVGTVEVKTDQQPPAGYAP